MDLDSSWKSIATLGLVLVLILALIGDGYFFFLDETSVASTTTATNSSFSIVTEIAPTTLTVTQNITAVEISTTAIYVPCNSTDLDGVGGTFLSIPENGTAMICAEFFYFNSTSYEYFEPDDFLSIFNLFPMVLFQPIQNSQLT